MKCWVMMFFLFLSAAVRAEVLFEDPTDRALITAFENLSEEEVKDVSGPSVGKKEYMLGFLYLNGDDQFNIEKDCQRAVSLLTNAWEKRISDAGYLLATMYYHGVCADKDIDGARKLAAKAAQDGYILAQRMLGMAYLGKSWQELYEKDVDKAIYWLSKAGDAGDRVSAGQLSYMYSNGVYVTQDKEESFIWLRKGIFNRYEEGRIASFPVLAETYEKGEGTEIDLIKAYKYYDLSGTAGVKAKQRISKQMTQEQIDEALRQSQAWQEEHNVQIGGGWIQYK